MKRKIILLATLIILIAFQSSNSQIIESIRLGPTTGEDCVLSSIDPTISFPNANDIITFAWTFGDEFGLGRSLFKYNLGHIPTNANVLDAKLSLYGNHFSGSAPHTGMNRAYIRKVTTDWSAFTATWEAPPDYSTLNQVSLEQSTSPYQDYPDIDVTNLVRDVVSDPSHNFGFMLILRTEAFYRCMNFSSGDCPDVSKRPLLVIKYNTIVGISQNIGSVPNEYKVSQNYPNPFNPVTKIKFDIPKSSFTRLTIFNELGKEVGNLVNENLNAGSYEVEWNGSNRSSGVYFYTIQADNYLETRKMTLIK